MDNDHDKTVNMEAGAPLDVSDPPIVELRMSPGKKVLCIGFLVNDEVEEIRLEIPDGVSFLELTGLITTFAAELNAMHVEKVSAS